MNALLRNIKDFYELREKYLYITVHSYIIMFWRFGDLNAFCLNIRKDVRLSRIKRWTRIFRVRR